MQADLIFFEKKLNFIINLTDEKTPERCYISKYKFFDYIGILKNMEIKNMKLRTAWYGSLVGALLLCGGCSVFSITPAPVEPQQLQPPAPATVVESEVVGRKLSIDELIAESRKVFRLGDDVTMAGKSYTLDAGKAWEQAITPDWQIFYAVHRGGYLEINSYTMPLSMGSAVIIPGGQQVTLCNIGKEPLEFIVISSEEVLLDTSLDTYSLDLTAATEYNGMTTSNLGQVDLARSYEALEKDLPDQRGGRYQMLSGSTTDIPTATVSDAQSLSPEEAAAVAQELKDGGK